MTNYIVDVFPADTLGDAKAEAEAIYAATGRIVAIVAVPES